MDSALFTMKMLSCSGLGAWPGRFPSDSEHKQQTLFAWFAFLASVQASLCACPSHFVLSRLAYSQRTASLRLGLETVTFGNFGFAPSLRSIRAARDGSDASYYIIPMPPMSGMAGAAGAAGAGLSATRDSVVSRVAAMEAAFCRAERVTLVGSTIPAAIMST